MPDTYLEPAGDHVLVVDKDRTQTIGEVELPDNVRQQEMVFGYVISVGPECSPHVAAKNTICYGPYAGKSILMDGMQFRLLREAHIEAYIREQKDVGVPF